MSFDVVLLDTHHSDQGRAMTETVTEASFHTVPHGHRFQTRKPPRCLSNAEGASTP